MERLREIEETPRENTQKEEISEFPELWSQKGSKHLNVPLPPISSKY